METLQSKAIGIAIYRVLQQPLDDLLVVPLGGVKEAGLVLGVDGKDVGLVLQEGVDGGHVALLRRQQQRRAVVEVPPLDVGVAPQEVLYDLLKGFVGQI